MVVFNVITMIIIVIINNIIIIIITTFAGHLLLPFTFADTQISKLGLSTLISERQGPPCSLFYNVIYLYV
jgi:hypothetical protein